MPALSARERRYIRWGAVAAGAILLFALAAFPYLRRWSAREDAISSAEARLFRMRWLADHAAEVSALARRREGEATGGRMMISGRTVALAASALQRSVQQYAESSGLSISRLDVAGTPDTIASAMPVIPATLSATGDLYAITDFLSALREEALVIDVSQMTVVSNSALRDGMLQLNLTLRAPAVIH